MHILYFFITTLSSGGISFIFINGLMEMQRHIYGSSDTILFIYSNYLTGIIVTTVMAAGFCIFLWLASDYKKKYLVLAVGILICGTIVETFDFFKYGRITADSIYLRDGVWTPEVRYAWSQISRADLEYYFSNKSFEEKYLVTFQDGRQIDLASSYDLLRLDAIFKARNVPIYRQPIDESVYRKILGKSEPQWINSHILKLFPYQCSSQSNVVFSSKPVTKIKLELTNLTVQASTDILADSLLIPVFTEDNQEDFFYILMGKTTLKVNDLKGALLVEINLPTKKKYPGPILLTADGNKVIIELEGKQLQIPGIKALAGNIQGIGAKVTVKTQTSI